MLPLDQLKELLYVAVIADALDSMGFRQQAVSIPFQAYTGIAKLAGRCKTTLWADMYDEDKHPYELELEAVDSCRSGDILICAAGGSRRSGIWGELLSTAAMNSGCCGAIVHGAVRDIEKMRAMQFPVLATDKSPYDSLHRQRVVDVDVKVVIDGVVFAPNDLVFADEDGLVVIPAHIEEEVIRKALEKVQAENITRDAIREGMKATAAYEKYGVL
ncbi:RraA family protein [Chitinophaga defluvii]|uniref:RraA family protein n=1 Tax=Chitinophaga defluvii TaxID=3163343 RepID=A0ABV2T533_9BACT